MDLGLKGKKAIIGGAARGISRAITELLAVEGCDIGMFSRNAEALDEHATKLSAHGGKIAKRAFVLEDREGYRAMLGELAEELGGCDIFIHSISSSGTQATGDWEQTFNVDIMGAVDACETLQPYLARSGNGSVIMMSTTAAVETFLAPQAFNALKAALLTYAKQLSQAWAPEGIRVNSVSPGPISYAGGNWEGAKQYMPKLYEGILANMPMGRLGTPEEVAKSVVFLSSPAASYVTGTNLIVDGGFTKRVQF